jgi:HAD superfamily hydrolase (TIGR01549 family)
MPTKVVAFDLWNTLVSGSPPDIIGEISSKLGFDSSTQFWAYCDTHFFNKKTTLNDFIEKIIKERNLDLDSGDLINAWEQGWKSIKVFSDSKPFLEKMKKKYKLVLISNTSSEDGLRVLQKFGLDKYFDYMIMSFDVGLAKPDPKMFELVLEKFSVKPDEVVYIGDGFKNDFLGAKNVGFNVFLIDRVKKHPEYAAEQWYITSFKKLENMIG